MGVGAWVACWQKDNQKTRQGLAEQVVTYIEKIVGSKLAY